MSDQPSTVTGAPKKRGIGFPQLALEPSVEAILAMGQHGADHSQDAAAAYMGHSTTNSGAFRNKLAALRDWGLIVRGEKDRVVLSELARELVLAGAANEETRPLLLEAFSSCRVFDQLYEDSAKSIPQELQRFRTVVVMRHGVATDQADKFLDSFVESAVFAGLATVEGNQVTLLPRSESVPVASEPLAERPDVYAAFRVPDAKPPIPPLEQLEREAALAEASLTPQRLGTPIALRQSWPIDGGEIEFVIRTAKALPPTIYAVVAEMAEVAAKMEALLKPAQVEAFAAAPVGDDD